MGIHVSDLASKSDTLTSPASDPSRSKVWRAFAIARMTPCMAGLSITYQESGETNRNREHRNRQGKKRRHGEEQRNIHERRFKRNCTNTGRISQSCHFLVYDLLHSATCTSHAGGGFKCLKV